jgi:hypothetical protein
MVRTLLALLVGLGAMAWFSPSSPSQDQVPTTSKNLRYYTPSPKADPPRTIKADVVAYGGSPAGVTATIQAKRMGKSAVLIVTGKHVGGLTSGGLTATDVGNRGAIGGMANEFYQRVGQLRNFRPSEAEKTFRAMLADAGVEIVEQHWLSEVVMDGKRIKALKFENGNTAEGLMYIDATYEGDLFAKAKVSYHVGRESNATYGETLNGVQFRDKHNFLFPVDPYKIPGDPKSGLLWGISPADPGKPGEGDRKVQAYNFRVFLTQAPDRLPFPRPPGYDPKRYELLARYLNAKDPSFWKFGAPSGPFQLKEGDCNNDGAFSTDYIGGNYDWPEGDYQTRERIFQDHVNYQQGLKYFMCHDPSVHPKLRETVKAWGLHPKEFVETGGWPHQLYIREGRRMISDYVMTEHDCLSKRKADDSVGLASYNMDSHNCQRVVINGQVRNEGDVQVRCPMPYPISYRSIRPKKTECENLLVPVCVSASHIAYGSIRMEPVFMILGQSAGTAAALAIDGKVAVQDLDYARLRERLLADGQILEWKEPPPKAK